MLFRSLEVASLLISPISASFATERKHVEIVEVRATLAPVESVQDDGYRVVRGFKREIIPIQECAMRQSQKSISRVQWSEVISNKRLTLDVTHSNQAIDSVEIFYKDGKWTEYFNRRSQTAVVGHWHVKDNWLYVLADGKVFRREILGGSTEERIIIFGEQPTFSQCSHAEYHVNVIGK